MNKLQKQFVKCIETITVSECNFTKDLYQFISVRGDFIAHFNQEGFIKARFRTLADFDQTIEWMLSNAELKALVKAVPAETLAKARFKVASLEANLLVTQARIMLSNVESLQREFTWKLV